MLLKVGPSRPSYLSVNKINKKNKEKYKKEVTEFISHESLIHSKIDFDRSYKNQKFDLH